MTLSLGARVVRAVLCVVVLGVPVFLLALAVRLQVDAVLLADEAAIAWATAFTRSSGLVAPLLVMQVITHPTVVYAIASLVAAWVWIVKGLRARAIWAFTTMMVAWITGEVAKVIVQRARPVLDDPLSLPPGYSFPSGHALNITVAVGVVVLLLWPLMPTPARIVAVSVGAVLVLAVGANRVFLGVHFPSDVVAGYILGCCITFSSWIGFVGPTAAISSSASSVRG